MREAVNDVIEQRARDPQGLQRTITASFAIHIGIVALFGLMWRSWLVVLHEAPKMMTISLGVSPGPRSGGMTAIGGRPVDRVEPPKKTEPILPVTPKTEVALNVPPKTRPAEPAALSPSWKPTTGAEVRTGTSLVATGARGEGVGLSFGGGGGPQLNLAVDFCCPLYGERIVSIISRDWRSAQLEKGQTTVMFVIESDGTVHDTTVERTSGRL